MECEYDYPPALYEAVHSGNDGDLTFYLEACAGARSVLELGCGGGRIGVALAAAGLDVIGLDTNQGALVVASQRGLRCLAADMRNFQLRHRFDRIVIPYNGLYCLLRERDVVKCLTNARAHLNPGGQIIFDGYVAACDDEQHATGSLSTPPQLVAEIDLDGRRWDVFEETILRGASRRVDAIYHHVAHDGADEVSATIRQRYLHSYELHDLLSRAGLCLESLHGDFKGGAFTPASEHMIVRAGVW